MTDEPMVNTPQKIADNVVILALARVSMVAAMPMIGFVAYLGNQYLEQKFQIVGDRVTSVERRASDASTQVAKVNDRLITVETKQTQDAAASEKFQTATLTRLDRVQDSIVGLSNAVSALTATIQALERERTEQQRLGR